jgi:hypothetical protein
MRQHIRKILHPQLRQAVRCSPLPNFQIAMACGFIHPQDFSRHLHADSVPITQAGRLSRVAAMIGYSGPLFVEDVNESPMQMHEGRADGAEA